MKAEFRMEPFPHVLLREFYTDNEMKAVMEEKKKLDPHLLPPEMTGSAIHGPTGHTLKYNSGLFLSGNMPHSEMISCARNHMFDELLSQVDCKWWGYQWRSLNTQSWMLSRYTDGQYYNAHIDKAQFTLLIWFYEEPKPFTGGDLIFPDFDNYTIPCDNNTGIIFYGQMRHEVPPVKGEGRYTLTCFTSNHEVKKK